MKVKLGEVSWNEADALLEAELENVKYLCHNSGLPDEVDISSIDDFVYGVCNYFYKRN